MTSRWKISLNLWIMSVIVISGCNNNHPNIQQGYIEGDYSYIASQVAGRLIQSNVKRGSEVVKNQPLFTLEPKPQSDAVLQAEAEFRQAKFNLKNLQKGKRPSELAAIQAQRQQVLAQLDYAQKTVIRYQALYKNHFIEKSSLDQAVSNVNDLQAKLSEISENMTTAKLAARIDEIKAAEANLTSAAAALNQAKWQLKQKTILSPITGEVFDLYYYAGEVVPPDHPVLSILETDNTYLVTYVPEPLLSHIKLNQNIPFTCDGCSSGLTAKIRFISPSAEFTPPVIYSEKTREKLIYKIEADLTPDEQKTLHPGQPVTVVFK